MDSSRIWFSISHTSNFRSFIKHKMVYACRNQKCNNNNELRSHRRANLRYKISKPKLLALFIKNIAGGNKEEVIYDILHVSR